jgi:DNA-binding Xre family transcriptional regulator
MIEQAQFAEVLQSIKAALKNNGWTYQDLGRRLSIPESTIKKMFIAKDWPFSRLQKVCRALNLDLADLLDSIRERAIAEIEFTESQEKLFKQTPLAFELYWHLVYERSSTTEFATQRRMQRPQVFHLLRLLDQQNLIALLPNDELRVPSVRPVRWSQRSAFVRDMRQKWAQKTVEDAAQSADDHSNLVVQYFQLSRNSAEEFTKAVSDLEQQFATRTARDMAFAEGELRKMRVVFAVADGSFI